MTKVKVTTVGNCLGVVIPREVLTRLRVGKGDILTVVESPNGVELSPYDLSKARITFREAGTPRGPRPGR